MNLSSLSRGITGIRTLLVSLPSSTSTSEVELINQYSFAEYDTNEGKNTLQAHTVSLYSRL